MRGDSYPKIKLTFEVSIPSKDGGPSQRYSISRALKARWSENPKNITNSILDEIKNYRGSFVGDIIQSLHSLVRSEHLSSDEEKIREFDIARYSSSIIESMVFSSIKDELHKEVLDICEINEWDGTTKKINKPSAEEIKNSDIDKVMTLLGPKIRHALFLISKDIK